MACLLPGRGASFRSCLVELEGHLAVLDRRDFEEGAGARGGGDCGHVPTPPPGLKGSPQGGQSSLVEPPPLPVEGLVGSDDTLLVRLDERENVLIMLSTKEAETAASLSMRKRKKGRREAATAAAAAAAGSVFTSNEAAFPFTILAEFQE